MMKAKYSAIISMAFTSMLVMAQNVPNDADSVKNLDDLVVVAAKVIHKADKDIYFPNKKILENSSDGLNLLKNMMIPSITVNDIMGSIKSLGENVQVRINGREATITQVRALLPETIKKVEWIDNPGLRYNGASAVLNFIVSNPQAGGSLMVNATPAITCAWGDNNASLKLNKGKSQFGVNAAFKLTNRIHIHREYNEEFTYEDGNKLTRVESPIGGYITDTNGSLSFDYSYIKPDTTVIWVGAGGFKRWDFATRYDGKLTLSNGDPDILLNDENHENSFSPYITGYWEQHFKKNQLLAVNMNISFQNGESSHKYLERDYSLGSTITDISTKINEHNKAWGFEANYIKSFKSSKITFGTSYSANRNKGKYVEPNDFIFRQNRDYVYIFGEYFQNFGKVSLTAGIGANYIHYVAKNTGQGNHSWNYRPRLTATYRINDHHRLRLSFSSWQGVPSLSEMSIVPQQIDGFQWVIGNPELKTSQSYRLLLRYYLNYSRFSCTFSARGYTSPNAIAAFMRWEDSKLIKSYENSKGLKTLGFSISPQIEIIPDWLMCSGTLQYKIERMKGSRYTHHNRNLSGDITAILQHWGFSLTAQYSKASKDLYGEEISFSESMSLLALSYRWKWFEFTAGVYCPFTKYDTGSSYLSKYNTNSSHIRLDMARMPFVQIQYNLKWGRRKSDVSRLINSNVSAESSSVGSR